MKIILMILAVLCLKSSFALQKRANNVYVIFYATSKGKTGHMGIAVDNYKIIYLAGNIPQTVVTGELTYYDLWPDDDYFTVNKTGKDIPGMYYKLPVSDFDEITLNSLYDKGLPHKENYPCDGLLSIPTNYKKDKEMIIVLDSMMKANRKFNGRRFNCSDFVRIPLENLLHQKLTSREFIPPAWSTTPNKLYRRLRSIENITVIKNADKKACGSFIGQRVIYKLFHNKKGI